MFMPENAVVPGSSVNAQPSSADLSDLLRCSAAVALDPEAAEQYAANKLYACQTACGRFVLTNNTPPTKRQAEDVTIIAPDGTPNGRMHCSRAPKDVAAKHWSDPCYTLPESQV